MWNITSMTETNTILTSLPFFTVLTRITKEVRNEIKLLKYDIGQLSLWIDSLITEGEDLSIIEDIIGERTLLEKKLNLLQIEVPTNPQRELDVYTSKALLRNDEVISIW